MRTLVWREGQEHNLHMGARVGAGPLAGGSKVGMVACDRFAAIA